MKTAEERTKTCKEFCAQLDELKHPHWFYADSLRLVEQFYQEAFDDALEHAAEIASSGELPMPRSYYMMVLEKCGEENCIELCKRTDGKWTLIGLDFENQIASEAETLPLAIALFARQLFDDGIRNNG